MNKDEITVHDLYDSGITSNLWCVLRARHCIRSLQLPDLQIMPDFINRNQGRYYKPGNNILDLWPNYFSKLSTSWQPYLRQVSPTLLTNNFTQKKPPTPNRVNSNSQGKFLNHIHNKILLFRPNRNGYNFGTYINTIFWTPLKSKRLPFARLSYCRKDWSFWFSSIKIVWCSLE